MELVVGFLEPVLKVCCWGEVRANMNGEVVLKCRGVDDFRAHLPFVRSLTIIESEDFALFHVVGYAPFSTVLRELSEPVPDLRLASAGDGNIV